MSSEAAPFRVAIDTGGTFTDVAVSCADGSVFVWKVSSDPEAPDQAVIKGLSEALEILRVCSPVRRRHHGRHECPAHLHGVAGRTGDDEGLRRRSAHRSPDPTQHLRLSARRPAPLVRRPTTGDLDERIGADGAVVRQLAHEEMAEVAERIREAGCEVVVVSFLNAYADHGHEECCVPVLREARCGSPRLRRHLDHR